MFVDFIVKKNVALYWFTKPDMVKPEKYDIFPFRWSFYNTFNKYEEMNMDVKSKFVTKYRDVNIRKISSTGELRKKICCYKQNVRNDSENDHNRYTV